MRSVTSALVWPKVSATSNELSPRSTICEAKAWRASCGVTRRCPLSSAALTASSQPRPRKQPRHHAEVRGGAASASCDSPSVRNVASSRAGHAIARQHGLASRASARPGDQGRPGHPRARLARARGAKSRRPKGCAAGLRGRTCRVRRLSRSRTYVRRGLLRATPHITGAGSELCLVAPFPAGPLPTKAAQEAYRGLDA